MKTRKTKINHCSSVRPILRKLRELHHKGSTLMFTRDLLQFAEASKPSDKCAISARDRASLILFRRAVGVGQPDGGLAYLEAMAEACQAARTMPAGYTAAAWGNLKIEVRKALGYLAGAAELSERSE